MQNTNVMYTVYIAWYENIDSTTYGNVMQKREKFSEK